jgi:probable addiction module antidote protein
MAGRRHRTRSHEQATIESLRADPEYAALYLSAILEDGDEGELLLALRRLTAAFGGVSAVAERAELNATALYRALSAKGNPQLRSLTAVLKAMGMRLAVQPLTHP